MQFKIFKITQNSTQDLKEKILCIFPDKLKKKVLIVSKKNKHS